MAIYVHLLGILEFSRRLQNNYYSIFYGPLQHVVEISRALHEIAPVFS